MLSRSELSTAFPANFYTSFLSLGLYIFSENGFTGIASWFLDFEVRDGKGYVLKIACFLVCAFGIVYPFYLPCENTSDPTDSPDSVENVFLGEKIFLLCDIGE